jgi:tripartite-type tricarboxylate transporter receptor subunit TctC
MTEVISGRVATVFSNLLTAKPLIDSGTLRPLAVSGPKRVSIVPNIPTVSEASVPGYAALQWYGLLAPSGTPDPIIHKLQAEVAQALKAPEVKDRLAADGAEPVGSTPAELAALIKADLEKWAKIARAANIQGE